MKIFHDPKLLQEYCLSLCAQDKNIALVPTMGFFHKGHERLMEKGRALADVLVVSLFVNPTQFAPTEDLASYPQNHEKDIAIAKKHGVDILFMPESNAMYFSDHSTWVTVDALGKNLCGKSRPTHFQGVCTVVAKLFLLVQPHFAIFGEKDWQQLAIIKRMVRDLQFSVSVIGVPICREDDGLALSSRNAYLTKEERTQAVFLSKGLFLARHLALENPNLLEIKATVLAFWAQHLPLGKLDYFEAVDPETLEPVFDFTKAVLFAVAMRIGTTRLIDNTLIG